MPSEHQIEIFRQHRVAQEKYVYFLLAAAGAAIAFAVTQTQGAKLGWLQIPLAMAVFLWALSFYFGCKQLACALSTLFANSGLLQVESGEHPDVGTHPQLMTAASRGIRDAIETHSSRAILFGQWQFRALILGSAFYLGWHVLEMWHRT